MWEVALHLMSPESLCHHFHPLCGCGCCCCQLPAWDSVTNTKPVNVKWSLAAHLTFLNFSKVLCSACKDTTWSTMNPQLLHSEVNQEDKIMWNVKSWKLLQSVPHIFAFVLLLLLIMFFFYTALPAEQLSIKQSRFLDLLMQFSVGGA